MAEASSSEDDQRQGRSRSREEREHRRSKKRRRKHNSATPSDSSSSDSASSSSDESSDGERRRRDRKRRKEKKRKSYDKSDKEKSREERHKDKKKRKKRRHRSDDSDESNDSDREKKRRLLKEAKKLLRKHKSEQKSNGDNGSFEAKTSSEKIKRTKAEHKSEQKPNGDNGSFEAKTSSEKVVKVPDFDKISEDHYFVKSNEFATWLREEQRIFFSDLSSEETHKRFLKFVDVWNAGKLSHKYYAGIKQASRTNHNWAIKRGPEDSVIVDEEEQYAVAKKRDRLDRKKFQKDHEALLDELVPKATGRERLMEMKAVRREQARAREDSPEMMKDRDVMGGGDDYHSRLAREKAMREKRQFEKAAVYSEKRSAFEEKEAAAMGQLRALVNVAGGKITIAKRE